MSSAILGPLAASVIDQTASALARAPLLGWLRSPARKGDGVRLQNSRPASERVEASEITHSGVVGARKKPDSGQKSAQIRQKMAHPKGGGPRLPRSLTIRMKMSSCSQGKGDKFD
jgi:hypothetical protein